MCDEFIIYGYSLMLRLRVKISCDWYVLVMGICNEGMFYFVFGGYKINRIYC